MNKLNNRWRLVAVAVPSAIFVWWLSALAAASDDLDNPASPPSPIFAGKIVVLIVDQSNALEQRSDSEVLTDAVVREIGNRFFITGTAYSPPEVEANWRTGAEVGIAWEKVKTYYAYPPEQFKNYAKMWTDSDAD